MQLELTQQECADMRYALQVRICVIETGTPTLRAEDARAMGKANLVKPLSDEQKVVIARHAALSQKLLCACLGI